MDHRHHSLHSRVEEGSDSNNLSSCEAYAARDAASDTASDSICTE